MYGFCCILKFSRGMRQMSQMWHTPPTRKEMPRFGGHLRGGRREIPPETVTPEQRLKRSTSRDRSPEECSHAVSHVLPRRAFSRTRCNGVVCRMLLSETSRPHARDNARRGTTTRRTTRQAAQRGPHACPPTSARMSHACGLVSECGCALGAQACFGARARSVCTV